MFVGNLHGVSLGWSANGPVYIVMITKVDIWWGGIELIHQFQSLASPWLTKFFLLVTSLGDQKFFLLLIPFLWLSGDGKMGARVSTLLLLSALFNWDLKSVFGHPRPFHLDPSVAIAGVSTGFGFPSGHAQVSATFWGAWAWEINRKSFSWVAAILVFLVGLSRVYLGVHFPTDVLVGWVVGVGCIVAYAKWIGSFSSWIQNRSLGKQWKLLSVLCLFVLITDPVGHRAMLVGAWYGVGVGILLNHRFGWGPWVRYPYLSSLWSVGSSLFWFLLLRHCMKGLGGWQEVVLGLLWFGWLGTWISFTAYRSAAWLEKGAGKLLNRFPGKSS